MRLPFGGFGALFAAVAPCGSSTVGFSAAAPTVGAAVGAAVALTAYLPASAVAIAFGLPNSKRPTSGPNFFTSFW